MSSCAVIESIIRLKENLTCSSRCICSTPIGMGYLCAMPVPTETSRSRSAPEGKLIRYSGSVANRKAISAGLL